MDSGIGKIKKGDVFEHISGYILRIYSCRKNYYVIETLNYYDKTIVESKFRWNTYKLHFNFKYMRKLKG
jgi:hypothetical protein